MVSFPSKMVLRFPTYRFLQPRKIKLLLVFCLLLLAVSAVHFAFRTYAYLQVPRYTLTDPHSHVHTVTLSEQGFSPKNIVILKGDTVAFKSLTGKPFWPASNDHPDHTIYPEFDPGRLIMPPATWSFTFDKLGSWGYHNHVNPNMLGSVTVIAPNQVGTPITIEKPSADNCKQLPIAQKQQCWEQQLELMLEQQGLPAAFNFFVTLYNTEPEIPKECHGWGHVLGSAAYKQYKETGVLVIRPEASYCGYGYFHSFIGAMVEDTGSFDGALDFCAQAEKVLGSELDPSLVRSNCTHGVGHGTSAWLLDDPENWGHFQTVVDQGSAVCRKLFTETEDKQNCFDGVFNEIALDLFNDHYNFSMENYMKTNDPYWKCQEQQDELKTPCYLEISGLFWKIFNLDLDAAMHYSVTHAQNLEERGPEVVARIAADWIQFDIVNDSFERNIKACRDIPSFLYFPCFGGIINGFLSHGNPADLHDKAFSFCAGAYLTADERDYCYTVTLSSLKFRYTKAQMAAACSVVPDAYKQNCGS